MLLLALLLAAQDARPFEDAVLDLRDPDPVVRERATQEILDLGREALPQVRTALAREADPEARGRLRDILNAFLQIRVELRVERGRVGAPLAWSVRLVNEKEEPVVLARSLDGSTFARRYPHMLFEVEDPDSQPVQFPAFVG